MDPSPNVTIRNRVNPAWGDEPYFTTGVERYIDAGFAKLEKSRLWPSVWQMACREEEIAEVGEYFEYVSAGRSILLVRSSPGVIKGFYNSCLHRGTQLKVGCGRMKNITCPYHGWRWSLTGRNRYVHDLPDFRGLQSKDLQLPECRVDIWGGFVFLNLSENAPSLTDYLGPIVGQLAPYRLEDQRVQFWRSTVIRCNWKIAIEAFGECYHFAETHPRLMESIDDVGVFYETLGAHSRFILENAKTSPRFVGHVSEQDILTNMVDVYVSIGLMNARDKEAFEALKRRPTQQDTSFRDSFIDWLRTIYAPVLPDLPPKQYLEAWTYSVFPNLSVVATPGVSIVATTRPNGDDPDSCILDHATIRLAQETSVERVKRRVVLESEDYEWGEVNQQDWDMMARIQRGMHARADKDHVLRFASYQEKHLINRNRMIDEYLKRE
jgi:phenylpropionate dioxygenase-like ring-hydroxylating dioxygenase large terminal subunit